jgi:hypothetical protein
VGWWTGGGCSLCSSTVRLFRTCRPTRPTVLGRAGTCPVARLVASSPRRLVSRLAALPRCHADDADSSRNHTHTPAVIAAPSARHVCYDAAAVASLDAWPAAALDTPAMLPLAGPPSANSRLPPGKLRLYQQRALSSPLLLPEGWSVMRHVPCAMWAASRPSCELSTAQKAHSCAPCRSACARLPRARAMSVAADVPVPCCTLCRSA